MKVYIDSACDLLYSSFYIKGMEECWGKENIFYTSKPFTQFKFNNHFLAFMLVEKEQSRKIIIDYADSANIDTAALDWSDLYCKINFDESTEYNSSKIICIGPSFGIKIYSTSKTVLLGVINLIKSYKRIGNKRQFLSNYKTQLKRSRIEDYYPNIEESNYIYFVGSLWKKEWKTNSFRANFIKACLSKNIKFEGGFAPRSKNDVQGFDDLTMDKRHDISSYVTKTKKSIVAFNTPAVVDCHGWKLAEFLCFGKAILSTDLSRKLPKELINNKHLLFTDGSQRDLEEKLDLLINDVESRDLLKRNAREYFESELSPRKVLEKIQIQSITV